MMMTAWLLAAVFAGDLREDAGLWKRGGLHTGPERVHVALSRPKGSGAGLTRVCIRNDSAPASEATILGLSVECRGDRPSAVDTP